VWEGTTTLRYEITMLLVSQSVGQSVGRSVVSCNQLVRKAVSNKKGKNVFR
jgi:hypothetical protein